MAHAWKACWVQALGGSNPPSSAPVSPGITTIPGFFLFSEPSGRLRAGVPGPAPVGGRRRSGPEALLQAAWSRACWGPSQGCPGPPRDRLGPSLPIATVSDLAEGRPGPPWAAWGRPGPPGAALGRLGPPWAAWGRPGPPGAAPGRECAGSEGRDQGRRGGKALLLRRIPGRIHVGTDFPGLSQAQDGGPFRVGVFHSCCRRTEVVVRVGEPDDRPSPRRARV